MRDGAPFTTARLLLRPVEPIDAEALHRIRGQMPYDPQTRTLDETRALIAEVVARTPEEPGWRQVALVTRAEGRFIGDVGLRFDHPCPRQVEIGFALAPEVRGQGLATEAVTPIVARLFAGGAHRVHALTDSRNVPTQRLLTRLGFRQEAHYVQSWPEGHEWFDEYAYAKLASEAGSTA